MKSTIAILSLIVSANVFALSATYAVNNVLVGSTLMPILSSATSSGVHKKEQATKLKQEKKDAIAKQEIQKQKVVRNSFMGGFALVLLLAAVVTRGYRQKQKHPPGQQQ